MNDTEILSPEYIVPFPNLVFQTRVTIMTTF